MEDELAALTWVVDASYEALRSEPDKVAGALVAANSAYRAGEDVDEELAVAAAARVISFVLSEPPDPGAAGAIARQLAFPAAVFLKTARSWSSCLPQGLALRHHGAVAGVGGIVDLLPEVETELQDPEPSSAKVAGSSAPDARGGTDGVKGDRDVDPELMKRLVAGRPPDVAESLVDPGAAAAVRAWQQVRPGSVPSSDAWCLQLAVLLEVPLEDAFAVGLSADEEFWTSKSGADLVGEMAAPFDPKAIGAGAAALLNGQLVRLRPRLFLRNQDAVVARPVGLDLSAERTRMRAELGESLQVPLLAALTLTQAERARDPKLAPRRGVLNDVAATITDIVADLGLEVIGNVGDRVRFDPEIHSSPEPLAVGDACVVVRPGFKDLGDDRTEAQREQLLRATAEARGAFEGSRSAIRIKAQVANAPAAGEQAAQGEADQGER